MIGTKFYKNGYSQAEYIKCASWCNNFGSATIEDKGEYYEVVELPQPTLEELKTAKLREAGMKFAKRRDAVRFVELPSGTYGFDCSAEDITNFLAGWRAAETSSSTLYKVWTDGNTKGLVQLTNTDFQKVFDVVRTSQYEAYAWYEQLKEMIKNCTTEEALNLIECK